VLSSSILYRHVIFCDPGNSVGCLHPVPSPTTLALRRTGKGLGTPHTPSPPILAGETDFGASLQSLSLQPAVCSPPLSELTRGFPPANRGFYFRVFSGLIAQTAAEYGYGGNWASSTARTFTQ
jgi:hypothetical protein